VSLILTIVDEIYIVDSSLNGTPMKLNHLFIFRYDSFCNPLKVKRVSFELLDTLVYLLNDMAVATWWVVCWPQVRLPDRTA
jgi:hypothetical protein